MEEKLFDQLMEGLEGAVQWEKGEEIRLYCTVTLNNGELHRFKEPLTKKELEEKRKELGLEASDEGTSHSKRSIKKAQKKLSL